MPIDVPKIPTFNSTFTAMKLSQTVIDLPEPLPFFSNPSLPVQSVPWALPLTPTFPDITNESDASRKKRAKDRSIREAHKRKQTNDGTSKSNDKKNNPSR